LRPEKAAQAFTLGDRFNFVQTRGGIQNDITGRQFYLMNAVGILHDQFTTLVVIGFR
jgi:hypothetical protein